MLNKVTSTMVTGSGSGEQVTLLVNLKNATFVAGVNQEVCRQIMFKQKKQNCENIPSFSCFTKIFSQ
jgi:hypothetical protein